MHHHRTRAVLSALFILCALPSSATAQESHTTPAAERAVLARLDDIRMAAQALDADEVFSFVLENDRGALAQNGELHLTRKDALDATRRGLIGLKDIKYRFDHQHITFLAPNVALVVGDGLTSVVTEDDRSFSARFVQSVVLVEAEGEWKVLHAHRSFPAR